MTDPDAKKQAVPFGAAGVLPPFFCHSLFPTVKTHLQLLLAFIAHTPHPFQRSAVPCTGSSYNRLRGPPYLSPSFFHWTNTASSRTCSLSQCLLGRQNNCSSPAIILLVSLNRREPVLFSAPLNHTTIRYR